MVQSGTKPTDLHVWESSCWAVKNGRKVWLSTCWRFSTTFFSHRLYSMKYWLEWGLHGMQCGKRSARPALVFVNLDEALHTILIGRCKGWWEIPVPCRVRLKVRCWKQECFLVIPFPPFCWFLPSSLFPQAGAAFASFPCVDTPTSSLLAHAHSVAASLRVISSLVVCGNRQLEQVYLIKWPLSVLFDVNQFPGIMPGDLIHIGYPLTFQAEI